MARPRKTVAELKASGTYRPSRHGERLAGEATPAAVAPVQPATVTGDGAVLWEGVLAALKGFVTQQDGPMLEMACWWHGQLCRTRAELEKESPGSKAYMALMRTARISAGECDRILSRFPLTPGDRARLGVVANKPNGPKVW